MPEKLIDVEKVVAVIRAEQALINGEYVDARSFACKSPGHCAVGALLFAAGMSDHELYTLDGPSEWGETPRATALLLAEYGLRRHHADEIITANDSYCDEDDDETIQDRRRTAVIARVMAIARLQTSDPDADAARHAAFESKYPVSPTPTIDE